MGYRAAKKGVRLAPVARRGRMTLGIGTLLSPSLRADEIGRRRPAPRTPT
jgi:hypothetical protein